MPLRQTFGTSSSSNLLESWNFTSTDCANTLYSSDTPRSNRKINQGSQMWICQSLRKATARSLLHKVNGYDDSHGWKSRVTFDIPLDELVREAFQLLALILPIEVTFKLHRLFLEKWSTRTWSTAPNVEFECFVCSPLTVFGLQVEKASPRSDP